jgi:hypothetical protein
MKKHYLLTFLLFLLFIEFPLLSTLYAQEKEQQPALQNRLAVSLLKWLDPVNPGIDLTWERMTDSRRSVQFNLGLMRDPIHITPFEQYRGFAGGIERKWYKAEKKKNIHPYFALNLSFFKVNYDDQSNYTLNSNPPYLDTFSVDKQAISFSGKAGWQIRSNRFFLDLSCGFGFKYKSTNRSGVNNPGAMELKPIDPNVYYSASKPGKSILPTIPVNIRFGVLF